MRLWCEQKDGGAYGQSLDGGRVWLDASFELCQVEKQADDSQS